MTPAGNAKTRLEHPRNIELVTLKKGAIPHDFLLQKGIRCVFFVSASISRIIPYFNISMMMSKNSRARKQASKW